MNICIGMIAMAMGLLAALGATLTPWTGVQQAACGFIIIMYALGGYDEKT